MLKCFVCLLVQSVDGWLVGWLVDTFRAYWVSVCRRLATVWIVECESLTELSTWRNIHSLCAHRITAICLVKLWLHTDTHRIVEHRERTSYERRSLHRMAQQMGKKICKQNLEYQLRAVRTRFTQIILYHIVQLKHNEVHSWISAIATQRSCYEMYRTSKATNQTESNWIFGAVILKFRLHCLRIVDLRIEFWCNRVSLFLDGNLLSLDQSK